MNKIMEILLVINEMACILFPLHIYYIYFFTALPPPLQRHEHDLTLFLVATSCIYTVSIVPFIEIKTTFYFFRNLRLRIFLARFYGKRTTFVRLFLHSGGETGDRWRFQLLQNYSLRKRCLNLPSHGHGFSFLLRLVV